jgi:hypothetical protein
MTDLSGAERLDLASRLFNTYRKLASGMDPPAHEYIEDDGDLLAVLISELRHYADWRGIDFGSALAAGNAAYFRNRAEEEHPYSPGEEVEHLQRRHGHESAEDDDTLASRGIITSIYPERDGTQTYYVRFLGEPDTWPLKSADLRPAPAFPRIAASQGTLESLAEAERLLVETGARIRSCQLRDTPPSGHDITDRDKISASLAEACGLAVPDILRLLEPQVAAWTAEITKPWRPVHASHPNEIAALDFPQPVQQVTGQHSQSAGLMPRTDPARRARGPRPG